ncbi:MAG: HD domain-containing protein [Spirochaetales bacterium]|nr:HD domain-containing protein [Spirochaetales bacterium]
MKLYQAIEEEAAAFFTDSRGSHDWEHTMRVRTLADHIAEKEGADRTIVGLAALLHDIGRNREDESAGRICHAAEGANLARGILLRHGVEEAAVERIVHCIETHRFRDSKRPKTIEAMVVFDADKLDAIGAVGIGRAFLFAGEVGARLHNKDADIENTLPYTEEDTAYREYMIKLRFIRDRMLTGEGRRLAGERHEFMERFFERLDREVDGLL